MKRSDRIQSQADLKKFKGRLLVKYDRGKYKFFWKGIDIPEK